MARKYTQMWTSVWADDDFVTLTCAQQTVYWAHANNQDISWCGVLPLLPQRLVECAADLTHAKARAATGVLEKKRFLVIDHRTAEVLVRRFVHYNEAMKVPNVAKAVGRAFYLIRSDAIRAAFLVELVRELEEFPDWAGWGALRLAYPDLWDLLTADPSASRSPIPSGNPSGNPSGKGSGNPSGNGSGKGYPNTPQPLTPQPLTPHTSPLTEEQEPPLASLAAPHDDDPPAKPKRGTRIPANFVPSVDTRHAILTEHPHLDLAREHPKFVDYWIAQPGQKGVKLDWDATWRNWMRRTAEQQPNGKSRRQQETDDMFARAMSRAQALDAADAAAGHAIEGAVR